MSSIVITNAPFVNLPVELTKSTLSSQTYISSGTAVVLSDAAYASLSPTCFTSGNLLFGGTDSGAGYEVPRATQVVPQTATLPIFNVVGGRVLVTSLWGQVTAAASATATTLAIGTLPTGGAQQTIGTAGAITSAPIGATISIVAGAVATSATAAFWSNDPVDFMINPGVINITTSANNTTAAVQWLLVYRPLDPNAAITAA